MKEFPAITTERLVLRKPLSEDIDSYFKICQNEEVMRFYGKEPYQKREQAEKDMEWMLGIFAKDEGVRWVITLKGKDECIGDLGFDHWEKKHFKCEIGYKLKQECWGKGYMTEAARSMIDYIYKELDMNRIYAFVDPANPPSYKVLKHLGFQKEGTLRESAYEKGTFIDLQVFSLLRREWKRKDR
ncbi:MAG: GNAT family N-acetyltransferase [Candidatus Odinarchaeota archaeon]